MTYANIVSLIALFLAMGGAAYAAASITGARVKDGSLTTKQLKDGTLTAADLSIAARNGFIGKSGDVGSKGQQGESGQGGPKGAKGEPGPPPKLTSSWAWQNTGLITDSASSFASPNTPALAWDNPNYGNGQAGPELYPNIMPGGMHSAIDVAETFTPILALDGMTSGGTNQSTGTNGLLTTPWPSRLNATVTLTFLHRNNGEDLATNGGSTLVQPGTNTPVPGSPTVGTLRHDRIQCKVGYGSGTNFTTFAPMGLPVYASSNVRHELVNVSLTADVDTSAGLLPAGTYNVAVQCRATDKPSPSGTTQWSFVSGNMVVVGSG